MRPTTRVVINTGAQYARTILNVCIGLYVTRVILSALGQNDFGVYSLVAGVVSMLSFVISAMSTTTQRFLSFHQTHSPKEDLVKIFSNSLLIHVFLSALALVILELVGLVLFDGWLNIDPERIGAAKVVFHAAIGMVILSFLSSPYNALLISHENLVYTSVISVFDSLLKLGIAFALNSVDVDRLILYAVLMFGVSLFNFCAYFVYSVRSYEECRHPKFLHFSKGTAKDLSRFAGWTVYGMASTIGRAQGVAIIINEVWSTAANAAYGVAIQVYGAILFVGSSLMSALAPQIVKAEGAGLRTRTLALSFTASKLCYLLLAAVSIPIQFYIEKILHIWLGDVPDYSVLFCQVMLISGLCDYITYGLGTANNAIGKLKVYNLVVFTIKFAVVPVLVLLVIAGVPLQHAIWSYVVFELLSSLARIPVLHYQAGLSVGHFCRDVIGRIIPSTAFMICACYAVHSYVTFGACTLIALILMEVIYVGLCYTTALNSHERQTLLSIISSVRSRIGV